MGTWFRLGARSCSLLVLIVTAACGSAAVPSPPTNQAQSSVLVSPSTRHTAPASAASSLFRIPLDVPPDSRYAVAIDGGLLWVATSGDRTVSAIDLHSGETAGPAVHLAIAPASIAAGEGSIWVVALDHRRVVRIDQATRQVAGRIDIEGTPFPEYEHLWITVGEGYVWLIGERHVVQIDPLTNRRVGRPIAVGEEVISYALGAGSLWTGSHDDGILARIDPATKRVSARIEMGFSIHGLALADGAAWVLDEHGYGVVRINPSTNQPDARVPIDFVASNLAAGNGSVWVAAAAQNNGPTGMDWIARIDPIAQRVAEQIRVGGAGTSDYFLALYQDGAAWAMVSTPEPYIVRLPE